MTVQHPPSRLACDLAIRGLNAGYGDQRVLHDVDLALPSGQVTVVLGPGGSGKTTLVRLLKGKPEEGLWWTGSLPSSEGPLAILSQLSSNNGLSPRAPIGDEEFGDLAHLARTVWSRHPEASTELAAQLETPPTTWRRWQRQLARFTKTTSRMAALYVFDEPDTDAPIRTLPWLADKARELAQAAVVVVVTHNLRFARLAADRVAILVEGRIIESGQAAQVFEAPSHPRAQQYLRMGS